MDQDCVTPEFGRFLVREDFLRLYAAFLEPMRTTVAEPFTGSGWLFEPKWDGWRTLCLLRDRKANANITQAKRSARLR